ncbi:unannotated protein [freshwater metagenome]|uniref:Unannotated protein n=1 Tax=freshwater metagenome TaxID=449393 RepID=A0A6J7LK91_9ZZZZ
MFKHNVRIFANERTDVASKTSPLFFVVSVVVIPKLVVRCFAINYCFATHLAQHLCFFWRAHNSNRNSATVEYILQCIRANAARCTPDQHNVTLLHVGAVLRHEHAIARRVAQRIHRSFFPREVCWLWHQLVGLYNRQVCETTKVCFITPNALVASKHRVIM